MAAIYGNSNHPVEVKKIRLQVWRLTDEIKALIEKKLQENPDIDIAEIRKLYSFQAEQAENLVLLEGGKEKEADEVTAEASEEKEEAAPAAEEAATGEEPQLEKVEGEGLKSDEALVSFFRPKISDENKSQGICLLSDMCMMDICFFSSKPFLYGQNIIMDFLIPTRFSMSAEVLSCKNFNLSSRIISDKRPPYRIHARWIFKRKGERSLLRNFVQSIRPDIPVKSAPAPKKEEADDFDELDDLGL